MTVLQCVAVCCSVLQCLPCLILCHDSFVHVPWLINFCRCSQNGSLWWTLLATKVVCVAVCCSVLQCVAVCRSLLQCGVVEWKPLVDSGNKGSLCCGMLQCVAGRCSMLQCVAAEWKPLMDSAGNKSSLCHSVLRYVAVCCSVLQWNGSPWWTLLATKVVCVAVCCSLLQSVAVCCSLLQSVAVYRSVSWQQMKKLSKNRYPLHFQRKTTTKLTSKNLYHWVRLRCNLIALRNSQKIARHYIHHINNYRADFLRICTSGCHDAATTDLVLYPS